MSEQEMKSRTPELMGKVKYKEGSDIGKILNDALRVFSKDALRVGLTNPPQAIYFAKTLRWQQRAAQVRSKWRLQGIHVPPIMIFSITNRCNLHCKGCYHWALHTSTEAEMSGDKLRSVITEAKELGISFVIIAGGEPLVRREILDIAQDFPEIVFLIFTNGLLIDEEILSKWKKQRNTIPVVSLEGYQADTDDRRGKGVYERLRQLVKRLKSGNIFWSVGITVTRSNFDTVTSDEFIADLVNLGCKIFFFIEYTPVREGTEDWLLTDRQRIDIISLRNEYRSKFGALFIAIPGDEEEIGGCLSAGRGFIHISAEGNVEPCPFAPYSDTNVREMSLKDALQSEFLSAIRQNREKLTETEGGCALWARREWVRSLLNSK